MNRIVPLKDNGEAIPVTQENKREFVQLSAQYRLYSSIKDQIENLLNGFYEIIPKELITIVRLCSSICTTVTDIVLVQRAGTRTPDLGYT